MKLLGNFLAIWIVVFFIVMLFSLDFNVDPKETDAPYDIGNMVTMMITPNDSINGIIIEYFLVESGKESVERYKIQYKNDTGELKSKWVKGKLIKINESK